ncbi:hypothetical protein [Nostoc sp.]
MTTYEFKVSSKLGEYEPTNFTDSDKRCNHTHAGLHQAIHKLRHGSVNEAKQLLARQNAVLARL